MKVQLRLCVVATDFPVERFYCQLTKGIDLPCAPFPGLRINASPNIDFTVESVTYNCFHDEFLCHSTIKTNNPQLEYGQLTACGWEQ